MYPNSFYPMYHRLLATVYRLNRSVYSGIMASPHDRDLTSATAIHEWIL